MDSNPWEITNNGSNPNPTQEQLVQAAILGNVRRNAFDIDFRRLLYLWPWVIGAVVLAFIGAKLYLRYTVPDYEASIKVNMMGDDQGIKLGSPTSIFDTRNPMQDKSDLRHLPL